GIREHEGSRIVAEAGLSGEGIAKPVGAGEVRKGEGTLASPIAGATMQVRGDGRRKRPLPSQPYPRPYGLKPLLEPIGNFRDVSCFSHVFVAEQRGYCLVHRAT